MADYYPLIARAVDGLEASTVENRATLYERARAALIGQLRLSDPPLDESEITRERLSLEDAIRRVETAAIHAAQAEKSSSESTAAEADTDDGNPPSLRDQGLRSFREVMAQAEDLGGAAAQANKSARDALETAPSDQPRQHAAFKPLSKPGAKPSPASAEPDVGPPPAFVAPLPDETATISGEAPLIEPSSPAAETDAASRRPASPSSTQALPPDDQDAQETYAQETYARPTRSYRGAILVAVLLLVAAGVAGAGYWQRDSIGSLVASLRSGPPPAPGPTKSGAGPEVQPKISDRVGPSSESPAPAKPAAAPAAAVAQKVVLYDEDPNNPQGKRTVGSAIWRTETVSPGTGLAPELVVRADVEIPERHMHMTWSLRRNTDKTLPASHTIEIIFTLPADFPQGGIANIPGVLMKTSEQARGVPLTGLSVKVTNGYFLIGLSAIETDVQRNVQFLKERDWFDIPIVYTNGKRAILAMEKGPAGVRAFQEAFKAWGE